MLLLIRFLVCGLATVSLGLLVALYSQYSLIEQLETQNQLLRRITELQRREVELVERNCDSVRMVAGVCANGFNKLLDRLGLTHGATSLLTSTLWQELQQFTRHGPPASHDGG